MPIKKSLIIIFIFLFSSFNVAKRTPTATYPGSHSPLTGLWYNSENGFPVFEYKGVSESKIATSKFRVNSLIDYSNWDLQKLFPDRQRELGYTYYSEIPGVIWIEKAFYIDETEITNIYWQEYLYFSGKNWKQKDKIKIPTDYYSNPKFRFFPITGISYEEALEFCKWRSDFFTKIFNEKKGYKNTDKEYTIFRFDLPSEAEWEKCAGYGLDLNKYPYGFNTLSIPLKFSKEATLYLNGLTETNFTEAELEEKLHAFNKTVQSDIIINCKRDSGSFLNLKIPFQVWSKPPNHFGIYNMLGNVSEMVKEKGVTKGGSWLDPITDCRIESKASFINSSEKVGFRTVCKLEWPNKL